MRLPLSFIGACLVALGLFALMLYMVTPPRSAISQDPVSVASFVRMDGNASETASRNRQQAPQPPQPQTPQPPTPPTPPTPMATTPSAQLPALDIQLPSLASGIAVNAAPAPSLAGLAPGAAAPAAPSEAAASGGQMGGMESEVMPLNDVRPDYPRQALQRGIEGFVKLAFTINRIGNVENIRVLEANPRNVFEREARRAAARWRFAPRTEGGQAVDREAVKILHFRLERG